MNDERRGARIALGQVAAEDAERAGRRAARRVIELGEERDDFDSDNPEFSVVVGELFEELQEGGWIEDPAGKPEGWQDEFWSAFWAMLDGE